MNMPDNNPGQNARGSEIADLRKKSLTGIGSLLRRQLFVTGVSLIGTIVLARILAPQIFGIYAIVAFVVQFFSIFSDVGIGAALIQKKEKLTDVEISTLFWLQQALAVTVVVAAFLAAPLALRIYPSLPPVGIWLIRGMAVSFLFASLKTVPAILMERSIDFRRIALVDIAEAVIFQATAVSFAVAGFGAWSFIIAALSRSLIGAGLMYALSPWRPSFVCRPGCSTELLRFGIPYQGTSILSFIKDAVTPLFVGVYVGAAAVGYLNWARELAFAPLVLSQSFGRVAFPAFSRLQQERHLLRDAIERSIRLITLVMFPITAIMLALAPDIIRVVFTEKWLPGIHAFYFYCTSPLAIGIMLPLYSGIVALGKSGILMKMAVLLLFLEWGMGVPFVLLFGFKGVALTQPIVTTIFFFIYKRILFTEGITLSILSNIRHQGIAALLAGLAITIVGRFFAINAPMLIALAMSGCLFFTAALYFMKQSIIQEFQVYAKEVVGIG